MRSRSPIALVCTFVLLAVGCSSGGGSSADRLVAIGAGLSGPAGLAATVYARGLTHASAFAQDAAHRLWVATADETDRGKDGVYLVARAGAATVEVVKDLHTPLGLLWYHDELLVASKRRVEGYGALAGTRFAEHHTVLTLPSAVGEVNGLALAPDGRIVMGISANCDHCTTASKLSGAIVSFRPDGTDLRVYASGIRAPVGLAYFPGTADLFATMNQRDDLGARTPGDWLSVVREGSAWGFPGCYGQGGAVCAGVPQPTAVLDPHAAVSGVAIVVGRLGTKVGTAAVVAEWATGKVLRVALDHSGSTYRGTVSAFLTGFKNPVPVMLDAGGALLVGDWTSGTIYRIRRAGGT